MSDFIGSGGIVAYVRQTAGHHGQIGRVCFAGSGELDAMRLFVVRMGWWHQFLDVS